MRFARNGARLLDLITDALLGSRIRRCESALDLKLFVAVSPALYRYGQIETVALAAGPDGKQRENHGIASLERRSDQGGEASPHAVEVEWFTFSASRQLSKPGRSVGGADDDGANGAANEMSGVAGDAEWRSLRCE